jgi:hypothetical protein
MMSNEAITELARVLKEEFGQDLTIEEVFEVGTVLIRFFDKLQNLDSKSKESAPQE